MRAKPRNHFSAFSCALMFALLTACATHTDSPPRLALIAPFEGRYREIGYNALYAARLALAESGADIELVPLDDGAIYAPDRARAVQGDPLMLAALLIGEDATFILTQEALGDLPALIVGTWSTPPQDGVLALTSADISAQVEPMSSLSVIDAAQLPTTFAGSDLLMLDGFRLRRQNAGLTFENVRLISSASLPDADFTARYQGSDTFAPTPNLLATLVYDASNIAADAILSASGSRDLTRVALEQTTYTGLNGVIRFEGSYWANAPVHIYHFDANGGLFLAETLP